MYVCVIVNDDVQAAHVRTEQEVLEFTRALGDESWLTRLFYSFETPEYVYAFVNERKK